MSKQFIYGALSVKVWKEIGMEIKNPAGEYIQIDDPMFDPIYTTISSSGYREQRKRFRSDRRNPGPREQMTSCP